MASAIEILTIILGLFLASAYLLRLRGLSSKHRKAAAAAKLPEGSMGWPLIGETPSFLSPHRSNSPGTFLLEHCSRYGKVFRSQLFGSPTIVSCDPEFNVFILQNEEKLFRASYPKAMHGILGKNSLLLVSGEHHKKLRNVAVSFISAAKSTANFYRWTEELSRATMESWKGRKEVYFNKEAKEFTLNLMTMALFNIKPGDRRASRILKDFLTYMKGFISLPLNFPGSPYAMAVKARARLSSTVREIIEERKSSTSVDGNDHSKNGGGGKGDFLDVIMGMAEGPSSPGLNEEEQVSIVLDILLGGYETTATLLSLIVYFLSHSPLVLQTLKEEHQAIRQTKEGGEPLNWEDYKQMGFTCNVISEALRYGNVVKFVHREAIQDVEFKGLCIPAGWKVLPVFSGPHFDPDLHVNPKEFDPWRWANNDKGAQKKMTPFGGGARLCPGYGLAHVELAFFLHHLVLNYRWKAREDEIPLAYPYVEFKRGLVLEIEPLN